MRRSAFAAVVLAAGIMLSGCSKESEETKKKKKKVKNTTEKTQITDDPSESTDAPTDTTDEPIGTTDEPADTTDEPTDTTMTTDTVPVDTSSDPGIKAPNPTFDFEEDALSFFADDAFELSDYLFMFIIPENGNWSINLQFDEEYLRFDGNYSSFYMSSDGNTQEVSQCNFSGTYDGFTRVNAYSYSTHVTSIEFEEFDPYTMEEAGFTTNYSFVEPYGFDNPDELTLYLPNTPMREFPGYGLGRVGHLLRDKNADYLQDFVLYNPNGGVDEMALYVTMSGMPELVSPTSDSMSGWVGHYYDKAGFDGSIEYDPASGSYVFNGTMGQSLKIEGAKVLQAKGDEQTLCFYFVNDDGYALVTMSVGDGLVVAYTIYTNLPELRWSDMYYPQKDG